MNLMPVVFIVIGIHFAFIASDMFLQNLLSAAADFFGSDSAFLPETGDSTHPYDKFTNFLKGTDGPTLDTAPGAAGGSALFLEWALKAPMCSIAALFRFLLQAALFNYDLIEKVIPTSEWGVWVKTIIRLGGTIINITLAVRAFTFAVRSGILGNPTMLAILGGLAAFGVLFGILDLRNVLGCS